MFMSHEKNQTKKSFQKPNILRRKPKVSILKKDVKESPSEIPLVTANQLTPRKNGEGFSNKECNTFHKVKKCNTSIDSKAMGLEFNTFLSNTEVNCIDKEPDLPLNIDSFLNAGVTEQNSQLPETQSDIQTSSNWCFVLNNNDASQLSSGTEEQIPTSVATPVVELPNQQFSTSHEVSPMTFNQNLITDCISSRPVKLKCDEPNCNKGFWSEQKLKAHKNGHIRQINRASHVSVECPVKKAVGDSTEAGCGRVFQVRQELLTHLNQDHTLDEALYMCEQCGRRFFWAIGLHAHAAGRCGRSALLCTWPGCGRAFRQPCRLREHARAHTGDRPYHCTHPNCGWSFRSASKLMRHARRHTGERQHECAACGRAFRRREHLRDHAARHHAPKRMRTCTHPDCEESFTTANALCVHMKKVHKKPNKKTIESPEPAYMTTVAEPDHGDDMFVMNLVTEGCSGDAATVESGVEEYEESAVSEASGASGVADAGRVDGGRAARTHCTWPLRTAEPSAAASPVSPDYVLEEDVQVDPSEGSENSTYTIRSDLFLHGNVLINEDSEFVISRELVSRPGAGAEEDSQLGLGLIDSHPTIDLMQEELMYADAAVDESSFRVFLLNGEELT